jgi:GntR family histidine utilization transcriptional repressor
MLGWQDVQAEALRRIRQRDWPPGTLIPNEADLARELGCARATVNRALQALADDGWLERKRRAGTRVTLSPQRRAQMSVPILRHEIEARGEVYAHRLLSRQIKDDNLSLRTLHLADDLPYALELRDIHLGQVPLAATADLTAISANEWLVQNAPFSHGTMSYAALPADAEEARHLGCATGAPVMVLTRETFSETGIITQVRLTYRPTHTIFLAI